MFDSYSEFLFPRQVVISKDLEYETYKDELINYCLNKKIEDPEGVQNTNIHGWHSDNIISDHFLPSIFNERIQNNVFLCLKNELKLLHPHNFDIDRMWIQISQKNSYNNIHNHPFSYYSGVFYVKSTNSDECGSIVFHPFGDANEYQPIICLDNQHLNKNKMNTNYMFYPIEGMLILFPSSLRHSVEENQTNTDRISIGFDIMFY